jgi:hypothetical protein
MIPETRFPVSANPSETSRQNIRSTPPSTDEGLVVEITGDQAAPVRINDPYGPEQTSRSVPEPEFFESERAS